MPDPSRWTVPLKSWTFIFATDQADMYNEGFTAYIFPIVKDKNLFQKHLLLKIMDFYFDTNQAEIYSHGFSSYFFLIVKDKNRFGTFTS